MHLKFAKVGKVCTPKIPSLQKIRRKKDFGKHKANIIKLSLDEHGAEKMNRLIDNLNDLDDVMNVYHNWEEE